MQFNNLPNFFILGAAKAGTTSLYHYLNQHTQIYLPKTKEPHFFEDDINYASGIKGYLKRHFKNAEVYPARGEATPAYFHYPNKVAPRLASIYGQKPPKFIVIFRDPVERAWSHYLDMVRIAAGKESFEKALELEAGRLQETSPRWIGYYTDGLYASQLREWLKYFDKACFLFLLNEDIRGDIQKTMTKVFTFLGVDPSVKVDTSGRYNPAGVARSRLLMSIIDRPSKAKAVLRRVLPRWLQFKMKVAVRSLNTRPAIDRPQLDPATETILREKYAPEVVRLQEMIGRDLSMWLPHNQAVSDPFSRINP